MLEPLLSHLPYIDHTVKKGGCEKTGTRLAYEGPQSAERHWEPIHTWATQSKQSMCKGIEGGAGGFESDLQRSTTHVSCALEQQLSAQLPSSLPASGEPFSLLSTNGLCFYCYPHPPVECTVLRRKEPAVSATIPETPNHALTSGSAAT